MDRSELELLVDPISKTSVELSDAIERDGQIVEGVLTADGRRYAVTNGIARMVAAVEDAAQRQTQRSFGYKWQQQATYTSASVKSAFEDWQVQRYGFENAQQMRWYFGGRRRVLDAGCGGGMSATNWIAPGWRHRPDAEWYGVDISEAIDVAKQRLGQSEGTHFVQADVMRLPFRADSFDTVFAEGVLHHTPSTRGGLRSLADVLEPNGELLFYVYRKKAPLREFADDAIREHISALEPAEAWEALRPLTALGKALADLHAEVDVPMDIPYLGIRAGRHDVQRLVYWHFLKLFWNDAFSFDENNHVNFDWYHPCYAHRQTEEEVRTWCEELGLRVVHFDRQESGFTVRALKERARA